MKAKKREEEKDIYHMEVEQAGQAHRYHAGNAAIVLATALRPDRKYIGTYVHGQSHEHERKKSKTM